MEENGQSSACLNSQFGVTQGGSNDLNYDLLSFPSALKSLVSQKEGLV